MDKVYEWGYNPIKDFLFHLIMLDDDISSDEMINSVADNIVYIIRELGMKEDCIGHLDFEITKKREGHFKVISYNMLTAMWFSGFFIMDCGLVLENNSISLDGVEYKFNKKTKKLTWKEKK